MTTCKIRPPRGWPGVDWREVWEFRELLFHLIWRDVLVRYKQTVVGVFWAVLQPFMTMLVFTLIFGRLAKLPSEGLPYPVFVFSSLVLWTFFANTANAVSTSLSKDVALVKKIYFPRIILPGAAAFGRVPDFLIAFVLLLAMMTAYGYPPGPAVVLALLMVPAAILVALGFGMWMTALDVHFRDIRFLVPFVLQLWMFASPVVYSADLVEEKAGPFWYAVYTLNPMVHILSGFRWALLGTGTPPWPGILVSVALGGLLCLTGGRVLRKLEKTFSDVI